ncbi:MAG: hypothetical protein ACPG7F_00190 [Aggregatilineales bacterium]
MIFKQLQQVINGSKTQTRRVIKPNGAYQYRNNFDNGLCLEERTEFVSAFSQDEWIVTESDAILAIGTIQKNGNFRTQYKKGGSYAIVPKRGQHGLKTHRIVIDEIRAERLLDITPDDALDEGLLFWFEPVHVEPDIGSYNPHWYHNEQSEYVAHDAEDCDKALVSSYRRLWESINKTAPYRWADNPLVWVYSFHTVITEDEYETQELTQMIVAVYPVVPDLTEIIPISAILDDSQYLSKKYRPVGQYRVMECVAVRNTSKIWLGFDINPYRLDSPDADYKPWIQYYPSDKCVLVNADTERAA